jgi:hypothetical protein
MSDTPRHVIKHAIGFTMCKIHYFNKIFTSTKSVAKCEILVHAKPLFNTLNLAMLY